MKTYVNKLKNLHEIDKFLKRHKLPKITQAIDNLYTAMSSKEIETEVKNLGPRKFQPTYMPLLLNCVSISERNNICIQLF
jgi:hypothetical protein